MTVSEFAFLAMGLVLGVAAGAALVEILRARPSVKREVRVTVATDAIPRRRSATLADNAFVGASTATEPARGGPADRQGFAPESRTPVREPRPGTTIEPAFRLVGPDPGAAIRGAVPISSGVDPMLTVLRASAAVGAVEAMSTTPATATAVLAEPRPGHRAPAAEPATAEPDRPTAARDRTTTRTAAPARAPAPGHVTAPAPAAAPTRQPAPTDGPCGEARRLADERCELAGRARTQATAAEGAHRAAQRADDDHEAVMAAALMATDARAIRQAKDDAQARFRAGRAGAQATDDVEAAARAWLLEINAINADAREAAATLAHARAEIPSIAATLERTAVEADVARIAAETAEAACLAAREAAADCEERASGELPGHLPEMPSQGPGDDEPTSGDHLAAAIGAGRSPRIFRLLRGDREAMHEMIAALAGDDLGERRRWQGALSDLIDAIVADSLAATALEFPLEHAFWGPFTRAQGRDIAAALSSLGYRFNGRGGWVDDRIPSQRDLSLALGYAGLDPMRMRHWPTEPEMGDLYAEVRVSAAEHLASAAGDLTLGELVTMLGRRADGLAEVWNAWGRIRPVLLEDA